MLTAQPLDKPGDGGDEARQLDGLSSEPVHFKPLGKPIEEGDEPDDWPSEPVRYKPLGKPVEEGDELDPLDDWDEPLD